VPTFRPDETTELSFGLGPSPYGIGVFALHAIAAGTPLKLCGDDEAEISHTVPVAEVPEALLKYCIPVSATEVIRPNDFGCMQMIWYVNHSFAPNAGHEGFRYRALRDIAEGEEITIDYNTLGIPAELCEDYFRKD
jgi:hypothetical protein